MGLSRSAIDRIGRRLRDDESLSEEHQAQLDAWRNSHRNILTETQDALRELGLESSARLKTLNSIKHKLSRSSVRLSQMQDIVGVRITPAARSLSEQDGQVAMCVERFAGARVFDRRKGEGIGYRAVHVVHSVGQHAIEIQIRTIVQHAWAQMAESLSERWGYDFKDGATEHPAGSAAAALRSRLEVLSSEGAQIEKGQALILEMATGAKPGSLLHPRPMDPVFAGLYARAFGMHAALLPVEKQVSRVMSNGAFQAMFVLKLHEAFDQ